MFKQLEKIVPHKEDILVDSPAIVRAKSIAFYIVLFFAALHNLMPEAHSSPGLIILSTVSLISSSLVLIAVLKFASSHYIACIIGGAVVTPFAALLGLSIIYGLNYNAHVLAVLWFPVGMSLMLGWRGLLICIAILLSDFALLYVLNATTSLFPHFAILNAANVRHEVESSLIVSGLLISSELAYFVVLLRRTIEVYKKKASDETSKAMAALNLIAEVERRATDAEQRLHDLEIEMAEKGSKPIQIVA